MTKKKITTAAKITIATESIANHVRCGLNNLFKLLFEGDKILKL